MKDRPRSGSARRRRWPTTAGGVALAAFVGFASAGCMVGPDYRRPEANAPASWNRLDSSENPVVHAGQPDDVSEWWRRLQDSLLCQLVDDALRGSPDLRMAQARLREARARRGVAAAGLYPSLSASASASRSGSSGGSTPATSLFSAGFDAVWELDLFGGIRRGVEAANADQESLVASLADTRVSLVAEVARNYFEVRALQIRLGISRDNLAIQAETLQLTSWRAQSGMVSSQDVEQARSNHEQTRAQIPTLETSLAEAEHRLDVLLGNVPGTLHGRLAAGGPLPTVPSQIAVGIPADTLRQRPDVRLAERQLAAETARIGVAQAARYPSLRLSGSIGIEALRGGTGDGGGAVYSLLGGITGPIFNAGRLRNQMVAQDAVREQAKVAYQQTVLAALQEVENALVALVRNRERGEALGRAVEAARRAADLARQRYGAGVIDFQPVIDTQRTVLSFEDSLASTRADGVLALIRVYKAMGGGWPQRRESRPAPKDPT